MEKTREIERLPEFQENIRIKMDKEHERQLRYTTVRGTFDVGWRTIGYFH
jgi:hypothetical protein